MGGIKAETDCYGCSMSLLDKSGEHLKLVSCAPSLPDWLMGSFFAEAKTLQEAGGCGKAIITGRKNCSRVS